MNLILRKESPDITRRKLRREELFINHCQNLLDTVGIMREALSKLQSEYNRRKPIRREKKLNDLGLWEYFQ